jgi:hypothetical protein
MASQLVVAPVTGKTVVSPGPLVVPPVPPNIVDLKVAILDAGLPTNHPLGGWLKEYFKVDPEAGDYDGGPEHGLAVSSAYLFNSLIENGQLLIPYSPFTFYRILDNITAHDSNYTMFKVLARIKVIVESGKYRIICLSLGPDVPLDDNRIHAWTATLDMLAVTHKVLFFIAAGNNGVEHPQGSSLARSRIQIPADTVNHLGIGAVDRQGEDAKRAPYSPIGPGRHSRPKPDLVTFGGVAERPFRVLAPSVEVFARNELGTSFSAPSIMRVAAGLLSIGGPGMDILTVKALLIHYADRGGNSYLDVGWGQPPNAEVIAAGYPDEARNIFHENIIPGNRAIISLPIPEGGFKGRYLLKATLCYTSLVSAQDPAAYSLTALAGFFSPDIREVLPKKDHSQETEESLNIKPFFDLDGGEVNVGVDPEEVNQANVRSNEMLVDGLDLIAPGFIIRQVDIENLSTAPVEFSLVVSIRKIQSCSNGIPS